MWYNLKAKKKLLKGKIMSKVSKSPIYESFAMLHPSGDLMCYTNKKRANWYIKLGLAKWINDNTFQLRFEPKGKGKSHLPFYTQKMQKSPDSINFYIM